MPELPDFIGKENDFEDKKRDYFISLGLRVREALKFHKRFGLWDKNDEGKKDWKNVSEHCLVEVARVGVFGKLMDFSEKTQDDLIMAAAIHDFDKKNQMERTPKDTSLNMEDYEESEREAEEKMIEAVVAREVVSYSGSVGSLPNTLHKIKAILDKPNEVDEQDLALLIMNYVDNYTIGSEWSRPSEILPDGRRINDLNRRVEKSRQNPKYKQIDEDGKKYFGGKKTIDMMERVGELNESFLALQIKEKTGQYIDPKDLPTFIDKEIRKEIR